MFFRGDSTDYGDCSTYTHVQCKMDLHAEYTRVKSGVFLGVAETIVAQKPERILLLTSVGDQLEENSDGLEVVSAPQTPHHKHDTYQTQFN